MGLFEEPRYILKDVCNHFYEMPENTIREKTFCCGSGAGLGTDENMEMRLQGRLPEGQRRAPCRGGARRQPAGLHLRHRQGDASAAAGLLGSGGRGGGRPRTGGNALVMKGEKERTTDLRGRASAGEEEGEGRCMTRSKIIVRASACLFVIGRGHLSGLALRQVRRTGPAYVPKPRSRPASKDKACVETDGFMRTST